MNKETLIAIRHANQRLTFKVDKIENLMTEITTNDLLSLVGIQKKILLFLLEECKKNRSRITKPISRKLIAKNLGIISSSIKKSVSRLCEK